MYSVHCLVKSLKTNCVFQGTADTASVGANREGDDFMKLMKALEISASTKEDPEQASTKHGDKQKV